MLKNNIDKIFLSCLLFFSGILHANNSLLEKKISIIAENKKVIEVLHEIEEETGIIFSFKSDIFEKDRIINFEAKDKTLLEVLDIIFANEPILYKEIGSQIVLYIEKKDEIPNNNVPKPEDTSNVIIKVINDTVFRYINTTRVKVYDTVRYVFFDTIRPKIQKASPGISFEFGFSPLINFPKLIPVDDENEYFSDIIKDAENPAFSYNIYAKFNKTIKQVKLSTGLLYTHKKEIANYTVDEIYSHTVTESITNWKLQLESANSVIHEGSGSGMGSKPDTVVWTYIYKPVFFDSVTTYQKTDTIQLSSNKTNQYHYLSFPITIGWEKQLSEKINFNINTGPSIDLLLQKKGHILNPEENIKLADFNDLPFIKLNLSWLINTGIYYKFNTHLAAAFQISYTHQLQSIFSPNFSFKKYNRSLSFSIGCAYFL